MIKPPFNFLLDELHIQRCLSLQGKLFFFFFFFITPVIFVVLSWVIIPGKVTWVYAVALHTVLGDSRIPPLGDGSQGPAGSPWDPGAQPQSTDSGTPQKNGLDLGNPMEMGTNSFSLCRVGMTKVSFCSPPAPNSFSWGVYKIIAVPLHSRKHLP